MSEGFRKRPIPDTDDMNWGFLWAVGFVVSDTFRAEFNQND